MSQRTDRISVLLRQAIQKIIAKGLHDPRVSGLITVTKITTADDLTQSTIYISVLPADRADLTLHGLRAASTHIRHQVGAEVAVRRIPTLVFKLDSTSSKQAGILDAIARATKEREEAEANAAGAGDETLANQPQDAAGDADTDER